MKTDMHFENEFEIWLGDYLLTEFFYVQDITGRELANYEIDAMTIPGRPGAFMRSRRLTATPMSIKAVMMYDSEEELREAYNELNGILSSNEPRMIRFSDEDMYSYYVVYAGCDASEQKRGNQKITINFFRGDPFKYGLEETRIFQDDQLQVINDGTADTHPTFEITPTENVTHIDVVNGDQYMRIGQPASVDATPAEPMSRVVTLGMHELAGWVPGTTVDDGVVAGQMKTKEGYFYTDDFGTGTRWHGPAEKYSLPYDLDDFMLEVDLRSIARNYDEIGRVEVSLLDINNDQVGKLMMIKYEQGSPRMYCVAMAGNSVQGYKLINQHGNDDGTWTRFNGRLKLSRKGDEWNAWIGWYNKDTGEFDRRDKGKYVDSNVDYAARITQIQVYIAQYADKPVTQMEPYTTILHEYNADPEVPYIAGPNDVITFDHAKSNILINGESIRDNPFVPNNLDSMGSRFFHLKQGINELYTFPSGKLNTTMKYRKRFI